LHGNAKNENIIEVVFGKGEYIPTIDGILQQLDNYTHRSSAKERIAQQSYKIEVLCPECKGARLNKVALSFKISDKNISELANMNLQNLYDFLLELMPKLDKRQQLISKDLIQEIKKRIRFL